MRPLRGLERGGRGIEGTGDGDARGRGPARLVGGRGGRGWRRRRGRCRRYVAGMGAGAAAHTVWMCAGEGRGGAGTGGAALELSGLASSAVVGPERAASDAAWIGWAGRPLRSTGQQPRVARDLARGPQRRLRPRKTRSIAAVLAGFTACEPWARKLRVGPQPQRQHDCRAFPDAAVGGAAAGALGAGQPGPQPGP